LAAIAAAQQAAADSEAACNKVDIVLNACVARRN